MITKDEVIKAMKDLAEAWPGQKFYNVNHGIRAWTKDGVMYITEDADTPAAEAMTSGQRTVRRVQ